MTDNSSGNTEVVSRFYDGVFVRHDMSRIDSNMRDGYIQHNADCPQGKAGFLKFFGTHTDGGCRGQKAGGSSLRFDVVDIFRPQDGKITEHWDVADTFTFFSQLGIASRLMQQQATSASS
jgi:predicted SnoaL-like aldol condensation-catalyzing enzyme